MPENLAREDDASILDQDRLFRRVSVNQVRWENGSPRPTSAVFKTTELSVNIESLLIAQSREPKDSLKNHPAEFLTAIVAGAVRCHGHPIVKDVDPPNDPAHGLVLGKKREGFANAMVRTHQWIVAPGPEAL